MTHQKRRRQKLERGAFGFMCGCLMVDAAMIAVAIITMKGRHGIDALPLTYLIAASVSAGLLMSRFFLGMPAGSDESSPASDEPGMQPLGRATWRIVIEGMGPLVVAVMGLLIILASTPR